MGGRGNPGPTPSPSPNPNPDAGGGAGRQCRYGDGQLCAEQSLFTPRARERRGHGPEGVSRGVRLAGWLAAIDWRPARFYFDRPLFDPVVGRSTYGFTPRRRFYCVPCCVCPRRIIFITFWHHKRN